MKRTFRLTESRPDPRRDVSDEIDFHLEMRTQEFVEKGYSLADARAAAAASFGDVATVAAECRKVRSLRTRERRRRDWMQGISMDLVYAVRTLRKSPAFTAAAVLTLALGIGATAAVFTVVNGVLLRPLPYGDPSRIAMVWITGDASSGGGDLPLSSGFFNDVRTQNSSFESVAAFRSWPYNLGDVAEAEQLAGSRVSPALFRTLGVRPLLGRAFTDEDAVAGGPSVALISHSLWQRRFGGETSIVGRRITLSGERFTVLGVMPPGFAFPRGAELPPGLQFHERTDLWTPLVFVEGDARNYGTMNLAAVARLKGGVTRAQAEAELDAMMKRFLEENGVKARFGFHVVELKEQAAAPVRRGLLILMGAVALVLLVACANVANLLIGRTAGRQREFAVRSALGAGRGRIARQLVTENVLLAAGGAALGVLLAVWGSRVMLSLVPGNLPRADDVSVDWRVIGATLAIALTAGATFGIATAMPAGRTSLAETLQSAGARLTAGSRRTVGRRLLVTAEVALSLVLLIGAGLLAGSFARLQQVSPGFEPTGALAADVLLPVTGDFDPRRDGPGWAAFFTQLTDRLNASAGVEAAGAVSSLALSGAFESGGFRIDGEPAPPPGQSPSAEYSVVAGDYFGAMGIPLVAGRAFDARDRGDGPPVVIINEELARRHFPGASPIGHRIVTSFDFAGGASREIIGIAADVKQTTLDAEPMAQAYVPETQMPYPFLTVIVRTSGDPSTALPVIRREVKALDPSLALANVRLLDDVFADSLARQRFSMIVISTFAGAALALALVGLYGVIALSVGQRRREIGVRTALGAQPRDVVRMILAEGVRVTAVGLAIGLAGALAVMRVLRSLLYGISASDATIYAGAAVVVAVVATVATYIPARRATRVDATVALRAE